jgi:hypothetical protein
MTQIHQVIASEEARHEIDPLRGSIVRKEQVLKRGSVEKIASPEHGGFSISDDGTFDVPEELAEFYLKQPDWYQGPNPFVQMEEQKAKVATKPKRSAAAK